MLLPFLLAPFLVFPQEQPFVSADPTKVDDDFPLQGEYAGLILPDDGRSIYRQAALQVVALGNGEFAGTYYDYGLPGAGWDRQTPAKLTGKREGQKLVLNGDEITAIISDRHVDLTSSSGNLLGRFPKKHRKSPTLGQRPPANAIVLFDGTSVEHFKNGKMTEDGLLKEGTEISSEYKDFQLHLEFRLPYMPNSRGQKRGNSGVYLQSRYEVQILDSFGLEGVFNECGALYRYHPPMVNMCLPPLQWQTYDITFLSARFDSSGNKISNTRLTVRHNGVLVHNNRNVERKTGAGKKESPETFPTKLQNHNDPVRFRNIWLVDLTR